MRNKNGYTVFRQIQFSPLAYVESSAAELTCGAYNNGLASVALARDFSQQTVYAEAILLI